MESPEEENVDVFVVTVYKDGRKDNVSKLIGVFSEQDKAEEICYAEETDGFIGEIVQIGINELRPNPHNLPGKVIKALPTFS